MHTAQVVQESKDPSHQAHLTQEGANITAMSKMNALDSAMHSNLVPESKLVMRKFKKALEADPVAAVDMGTGTSVHNLAVTASNKTASPVPDTCASFGQCANAAAGRQEEGSIRNTTALASILWLLWQWLGEGTASSSPASFSNQWCPLFFSMIAAAAATMTAVCAWIRTQATKSNCTFMAALTLLLRR